MRFQVGTPQIQPERPTVRRRYSRVMPLATGTFSRPGEFSRAARIGYRRSPGSVACCLLTLHGTKGGTITDWIRWFDDVGMADVPAVGGKNASLGALACGERISV